MPVQTSAFFPTFYLARYGYLGVNVFFAISDFVIAFSAAGQRPAVCVAPLAARVSNICGLPAADEYCDISIGLPHFDVMPGWTAAGLLIHTDAFNVDFVDPVYWTISCEVWFYTFVFTGMLMPVVRSRSTEVLALWLLIATVDQVAWHGGRLPGPVMTDYAPLFCAGVFLYRALIEGRSGATGLLLAYAVLFSLWLAISQAGDRFLPINAAYSPAIVAAAPAVCLATAVSVGAAWIIFSYVEPVLKAACIQAIWTWPSGARLMGIRKLPHSVMMIPARPIESEQ